MHSFRYAASIFWRLQLYFGFLILNILQRNFSFRYLENAVDEVD
jgi:hypothetical protein